VVFSPMLGQRSFLRMPQDANISVAIPIIAINFAFFMISELIHKINAFEGISIALSEIILQKSQEKLPSIAEIQKNFGQFAPLALEQQKLKGKARLKLPQFSQKGCLFWQRSFEQATSEYVALWKAAHFKSKNVLSITGGFGVDEWAWHQQGTTVISCDIQYDLNALVRFNQNKLGITYDRLDCDAESLLERYKNESFTCVYVDPDRRQDSDRLGGYWENFAPKIDELITKFSKYYTRWIVKMSPMTDFRVLRNVLPGSIVFYSVYFDGEVKELLLDIDINANFNTQRIAVYLDKTEGVSYFTERTPTEYVASVSPEKKEGSKRYIYEPHGGINNLNLNALLAEIPFLKSLTPQHTLFESGVEVPPHWGRCKHILDSYEGSLNDILKALKKAQITAASVTARNTQGLKTEVIRSKLGLSESDRHTLFITRLGSKFKAWLTV
jgi:hypothetical protein